MAQDEAVEERNRHRQLPALGCVDVAFLDEFLTEPGQLLLGAAEGLGDRYQSVQLLLNKDANDYNNRAVELRLEERVPNTNHWRVYEKAMFTLKRSFTSDFDF